jgi:hypothetical protein
MRTSLFWGVTQRAVRTRYRCCGTTYRFHFQGSINQAILGFLNLVEGTDILTLILDP